jgi:hypothetical protein
MLRDSLCTAPHAIAAGSATAGPTGIGRQPPQGYTLMARDKQINLEKAKKIISVDRVLLIGLISMLLEKGSINEVDLQTIRRNCEGILEVMKKSDQPVLRVHSEEVEVELNHLLSSFRT